jgi:hypothetical protein
MIPRISLLTCVAMGATVAALFATSAKASPVALTALSNQVTPWTGISCGGCAAVLLGGNGGVVNGVYEGTGLAITDASGTSMYESVGDAGVKIDWNAEVTTAYPVDELFLNLNTWLSAQETDLFLLGDTYTLSEFTYTVSEVELDLPLFGKAYVQIGSGKVDFNSDGQSLYTTYTIPTVPTFLSTGPTDFLISAEFDVASAYDIEGPGGADAWAEGYVDFTLSADGTVPEPATAWLVGLGLGLVLLALIPADRVFGGQREKNS